MSKRKASYDVIFQTGLQKLHWSHPKCFSLVAAETRRRAAAKNGGEDDSDGPDDAGAAVEEPSKY